ncbi:class I SAM-dependent methyltransferase [Spongorhabdus nitratireducens]
MQNRISFAEPERLTGIFDAPHREEWQNTSYILKDMSLKANSRIADVGAGTGYFSRLFAKQAPEGTVFAIDAEPNMVSFMAQRFAREGHSNIKFRQSQQTDPCLPQQLDIVFVANTYRFIEQRQVFLANLRHQISHTTEVVFVDLRSAGARVTPQQVMDEVRAAGFHIQSLDLESCPDHYIMKFRKALAA